MSGGRNNAPPFFFDLATKSFHDQSVTERNFNGKSRSVHSTAVRYRSKGFLKRRQNQLDPDPKANTSQSRWCHLSIAVIR